MMKLEIDAKHANKEALEMIRWFEKWGDSKWKFVLFHQLLIVIGWNIYLLFTDFDLSFSPLDPGAVKDAMISELPWLIGGIIFWMILKIKSWNKMAFKVGVLQMKGQFKIEGGNPLHEILLFTKARIQRLDKWYTRWSKSRFLFLALHTAAFFFLFIGFLILAKIWQKGESWVNTIYPSPWPVYILLVGIPLVFALFISMEIWRQNEKEYLSSKRFQKPK
jgi:hypothetical protein